MNKVYLVSVVLLLALLPTIANAATINAASCSQADVQNAINSASSGDTVNVPAGNCVWDKQLSITKGIAIKGAGAGITVITSGFDAPAPGNNNDERNYMFVYNPTNPSLNEPFRISRLTIDGANRAAAINIRDYTIPVTPIKHLRIDHNIIQNASHGTSRAIMINGGIYGVIDNNYFVGNDLSVGFAGQNQDSWNSVEYLFIFGSPNNMYIEDNNFSTNSGVHDAISGARYAIRYNTYMAYTSNGIWPLADAHGNNPSIYYSTMGVEVYGNTVTEVSNGGVGLLDLRGGKAVTFFNKVTTSDSSASYKVREEFYDAGSPTNYGSSSSNGQPQHVSDTYFWNNRKSTGQLMKLYLQDNCCDSSDAWQPNHQYSNYYCNSFDGTYCYKQRYDSACVSGIATPTLNTSVGSLTNDGTCTWFNMGISNNPLIENRDFFNFNTSFDGKAGIGCGPLASRPSTCTIGVGYWATNQSCSSVEDANVGANPIAPLIGTLYKCNSTNTWITYYTPYTYPHPLRTDCVDYPTLCDSNSTSPPSNNVPGDLNGDNKVDIQDLSIVASDFGKTSNFNNAKSDTNKDGIVDIYDIVFVASRFT